MKRLINENSTKTEKLITEALLTLGDDIKGYTIEELANYCMVSPAMIVKFAKNHDFSGFKELKYYVLNNIKKPSLISNNYIEFQRAKSNLFFDYIQDNYHLVEEVANKIVDMDYIVFVGYGPSIGVAKYFSSKINLITGIPVIVQSDEQLIDLELKQRKSNRLVILLSASLNTKEILDKISYLNSTNDNYLVIYENINSDIDIKNGIKLINAEYSYDYTIVRDRTLYFLFFELVLDVLNNSY